MTVSDWLPQRQQGCSASSSIDSSSTANSLSAATVNSVVATEGSSIQLPISEINEIGGCHLSGRVTGEGRNSIDYRLSAAGDAFPVSAVAETGKRPVVGN